jgi:hypothetical protein
MRSLYKIYTKTEVIEVIAESRAEAWLMHEPASEVERVERISTEKKGVVLTCRKE